MKQYHKNPRKITDAQKKALERDLKELGDLSGIVHDVNSDEIIGGNQRSGVFKINECQIEITAEYDPPTATGTIAEGNVVWQDERYSYRKVNWTPRQCEKANIIANSAGGDWDWDILVEDFQVDDLKDWGFEKNELQVFDNSIPKARKDIEEGWFLSIELGSEAECQEWYEKLKSENLKIKIVQ